jgi:GMP synthase (glutamine-hydrolysing)
MARDHRTITLALVTLRDDPQTREVDLIGCARAAGLDAARFRHHDAFSSPPTPAVLDGADALVLAGSKYSVFEQMPHLEELTALVREAKARHLPVFAICFGAQLLAHAFGGEVVRDHANEEYGTYAIRCADDAWADILFADMPDEFAAQCAHHDRITRLPAGATLLASSDRCGVQAFVMPGDIYGVQFHPERSMEDFARIIDDCATDYAEGVSPASVRPRLRESLDAESLVKKFIDRVVLRGAGGRLNDAGRGGTLNADFARSKVLGQ